MKIQSPGQVGFSLLELMMVVALIGLLVAGVAIFGNDQRNKVSDNTSVLQLNQVAQALQEYHRVCGVYPLDAVGVGFDDVISDSCTVGSVTYAMTDFLAVVPSDLMVKNFIYAPLASSSGDGICVGYHVSFEVIDENTSEILDDDHDVDSGTVSAPFVCDSISSGITGSASNTYDLVYPLYFRSL